MDINLQIYLIIKIVEIKYFMKILQLNIFIIKLKYMEIYYKSIKIFNKLIK